MNHRDQEKLLKEILPAEDMPDFRNASLANGLAGLRRERRRRHAARVSAALVAIFVLSIGLFLHSRHQPQNERLVAQTPRQAVPPALPASHVDFISDDQLLDYFTNEPVALIGKPGEQHLVLLGKADDTPEQF